MQSHRMIGYVLTRLTGVTFPYYVGCLFGGMLFRNIMDHYQLNLNMKEVDLIGSCSWFIRAMLQLAHSQFVPQPFNLSIPIDNSNLFLIDLPLQHSIIIF